VINRAFFFAQVSQRLFEAKLSAKPRDTLGMMLDYWEPSEAMEPIESYESIAKTRS
jgi:hypothetical protein